MDVRIGVSQSPRELTVELPDDTDREALKDMIANAVGGASPMLTLTDRRGREVMVPVDKLAYIELGASDAGRRIGFGS